MLAGEVMIFSFSQDGFAEAKRVMDNIIYCLGRKAGSSLTKIKIYTILITWWNILVLTLLYLLDRGFDFELLEEIDLKYEEWGIKEVKTVEMWFENAISEIQNNDINNSLLIDNVCNNVCEPIVFAIKGDICELFSANTINTILLINPLCLQKEKYDIIFTFRVRCLRNNKYEKSYLKDTLKKIDNANDNHKEKLAYLSMGFISMNGTEVPIKIDNELKSLRKTVLDICWNKFFDNECNPNLEEVNIHDFVQSIEPSTERVILEAMAEGIKRIYHSITFSDKQLENYNYPIFKDDNGDYSIDYFISSIYSIDSSKQLFYYITAFEEIIYCNCYDGLDIHEIKKYINAANGLQNKLKEIVKSEEFTHIFVCEPIVHYYLDQYDVEVVLNSIIAIMYSIFGDYNKTNEYLELIILYSKYSLENMSEEDKKAFPDNKDYYLWLKRIIDVLPFNGDCSLLVHVLIDYISTICGVLDITDEADERLLGYYDSLVPLATASKKMFDKADDFIAAGIIENRDDPRLTFLPEQYYDRIIEKYSDLIRKISGQEYDP